MRAAIVHPSYLPWTGFFDQFRQCDVVVLDDECRFERRAWSARARIKCPAGAQWLDVPVLTDPDRWNTCRDVRIAPDSHWPERHVTFLRQAYARTPYFDELLSVLEPILREPWLFLLDLQIELVQALARQLGLAGRLMCASSMRIRARDIERRVRICQHLGADCLLTGDSVSGQYDDAPFAAAGIRVEPHRYVHPCYPQPFGDFLPNLSVVDLLFNAGPESLGILAGQGQDRAPRAA